MKLEGDVVLEAKQQSLLVQETVCDDEVWENNADMAEENLSPIILTGKFVTLEPLQASHRTPLQKLAHKLPDQRYSN
jgi:hypothetical protein